MAPFVKINEFHINLDHVYYVEELPDEYVVYFSDGINSRNTDVRKGTSEATYLLSMLATASGKKN